MRASADSLACAIITRRSLLLNGDWLVCLSLSLARPSHTRGPLRITPWIESFWRVSLAVDTAAMSKATKRKHVTREVVEEFVEPQGSQKIVKVENTNIHRRSVYDRSCLFLCRCCVEGETISTRWRRQKASSFWPACPPNSGRMCGSREVSYVCQTLTP